MSGISHVSLGTTDIARSRAFYDPLLRLLGLQVRKTATGSVDYGNERLVFSLETPVNGKKASSGNGIHVAFKASDQKMVDAFYAEALRLGALTRVLGLRPQYSESYYGAFVLDLDGNKIEAVTGND